ncbi:MAG TPA: flippase [Candidatus Binataceae bacterium]|nr:flippase [Candidatus Binataceae bacterium]
MNTPANLTSGRLLARNTMINLAGDAAPFLVAIVAIPMLIRGLGVDRYGALTLVILAVGYFGAFNFGLGKAATKYIAAAAASDDHSQIPAYFWTSLLMMFGFGVCGAVLAVALSPWIVGHVLKVAPAAQAESLHALYVLAISLPFLISSSSTIGALAAFQRVDLIKAVNVPSNILYYLAPLPMLAFSHRLGWIVGSIVIVRVATWLAYFLICLRVLPELRQKITPHRDLVRPMLGFGGWVTVSDALSHAMEYADRFIIGALVSVAAVAYYAVPFQVTNKVRMIPGAISGVMFPAFSTSLATDPARTVVLFERSVRYILLAMFPIVLLVVTLAPEGLTLWLGPDFAVHSAAVMRWIAVGMFINSLDWTPHTLLQAAHRPDLTAKVYLVELPFFLLALWLVLPRYGVEGAAVVYAIRAVANAALLFAMACRMLPNLLAATLRLVKVAAAALAVIAIGIVPATLPAKELYLAAILGLAAIVGWSAMLEPEEKDFLRMQLRQVRFLKEQRA